MVNEMELELVAHSALWTVWPMETPRGCQLVLHLDLPSIKRWICGDEEICSKKIYTGSLTV